MSKCKSLLLPKFISDALSGGPKFESNIYRNKNGQEIRSAISTNPKNHYRASNVICNFEELQEINALFRATKGKIIGFKMLDLTDYSARWQIILPSKNIEHKKIGAKIFQLSKTYFSEEECNNFNNSNIKIEKLNECEQIINSTRIIRKPIEDSAIIYLNDKPLKEKIDYFINYETGEVIFSEYINIQDCIRSDYNFYNYVRFDQDSINFITKGPNKFEIEEIKIIEII